MAAPSVRYNIETLQDEPGEQQSHRNRWVPLIAQAARILFSVYVLVRLYSLVVAGTNGYMWAILYIECAIAYQLSLGQAAAMAVAKYGNPNLAQHRKRLRLRDHNDGREDLPLVDVLVPCCGESIDYICDTLRAAGQMDYPRDRFRVLVLDDGQSSALQKAVEKLGQSYSNIHYHCRGRSKTNPQVFNKAGNLNYALFDLQSTMDVPPEFIAVLDADFIPSPSFLRATLPHLLLCPKLALAGAPQDFYNLPKGDPMVQSLDHWQNVMIPQLNQLGSAFHGHSGCVIRRDVLQQLGGFPTISFSEDVLLSNMFLGTGFHVVSLREMLQLGRAPESLQGHVSQRSRWGIGLSQLVNAVKPSANNTVPSHLRWPIARQGMMIVLAPIHRVMAQIVVPIALLSGQPLVPTTMWTMQGVLAILSLALAWLFEWIQRARSGFRGGIFGDLEELWLAPFYVWAIFSFWCLPSRSSRSFVTGSTLNPWNHTITDGRLLQLKRDLWDAGIIFNLLSFIGTLAAMLYAASNNVQAPKNLLLGLAWPPILNLCYFLIASNWTPLACIISPPSWTNPMTEAMKPGAMDSRIMFTRPELQRPLRPRRQPLGFAGHYALVPLVLIGLLCAILWV